MDRVLKRKCNRSFDIKGYTLMELLTVLVLIGIITSIAIPSIAVIIEKAKEEVCNSNRLGIGQTYKTHLISNNLIHSEIVFNTYMLGNEIIPCPENGIYTYKDGMILCDVHVSENDNNHENDDVPYL